MSYYQKYRPKQIADLNLNSVRSIFESILSSGKVAHAYLFVGPKGSGKTSAARILAKLVNCELNKEVGGKLQEACDKCGACISLEKSNGVDVIEIDAASNGLVDDIRDLREKIKLAPIALRKKVYIIDEVHMVSTAGFNALLKTLEEPPAHAMFILCTTEAHKIPDTIASRCTKINFTKATAEEMISSLRRASAGEGLEVDEAALLAVVGLADGSFREGHKILEQLSVIGSEITEKLVLEKMGGASKVLVKMAVEAALSRDSVKVMEIFDEFELNAARPQVVLTMLIEYLKEQLEVAVRNKVSIRDLVKMIEQLILSSEKIKMSPDPLLPIELVLLDLSLGKEESGVKKEINSGVDRIVDKSVDSGVKSKIEIHEDQEISIDTNLEKIKNEWNGFLDHLSSSNGSLAGLLRRSTPIGVTNQSVTISVSSRFQKDMLERDVKKRVIEEAMEKFWGPLTIKTVCEESRVVIETGADVGLDPMVDSKVAEEIFS